MNIVRALFVVLVVLGLFAPTYTVRAQSSGDAACTCWCGQTGSGAESVSAKTPADCPIKCEEQNKQFLGCFQDPKMSPQFNQKCFSDDADGKKACAEMSGVLGDTKPADCMPGSQYCFPDPTAEEHQLKLNVAIGSTDTVVNLSEYINAFYRWLLGAALLFSIVMIMIGGLQYTIGSGAGDTQKAKDRIKNAVIGLILALSVYVILYTVNPNLLELKAPQLPLVKPIMLSETDRCGYLTGKYGTQPYTIANGAPFDSPHAFGAGPKGGTSWEIKPEGGKKCGDIADVIADEEGNPAPSGTQCFFDYCEKKEEQCMGNMENAKCLECGDVVDTAVKKTGVIPSSAVCRQFQYKDETKLEEVNGKTVKTLAKRTLCGWTKDGSYNEGLGAAKFDSVGSCVKVEIDCNDIEECSDYEDADSGNANDNHEVDELNTDTGFGITCNGSCGDISFMDVCDNDPCGVSASGCETEWDPLELWQTWGDLGLTCDEVD